MFFCLGFRYHSQVYSGQVLQEVPRARVSGARFSRLHPHSQGEIRCKFILLLSLVEQKIVIDDCMAIDLQKANN